VLALVRLDVTRVAGTPAHLLTSTRTRSWATAGLGSTRTATIGLDCFCAAGSMRGPRMALPHASVPVGWREEDELLALTRAPGRRTRTTVSLISCNAWLCRSRHCTRPRSPRRRYGAAGRASRAGSSAAAFKAAYLRGRRRRDADSDDDDIGHGEAARRPWKVVVVPVRALPSQGSATSTWSMCAPEWGFQLPLLSTGSRTTCLRPAWKPLRWVPHGLQHACAHTNLC